MKTRREPARAPAGAVRIIGGRWKRTPLEVPPIPGLRPTPGRVRATVFDWLAHLYGNAFGDLAVLDLFAGTGALGLEAASRGAPDVVLVESHTRVAEGLARVIERLDAVGVEVRREDAASACASLLRAGRRFDIVFLDPPFDTDLLDATLAPAASLCGPDGVVYAESAAPISPDRAAVAGLEIWRNGRAGAVSYHLLRRKKQ